MAGHNGYTKFLRVNREDEVINLKIRDTLFGANSSYQEFNTAGGGALFTGINQILNPIKFIDPATGTFSFAGGYNSDQLLQDIRKVKSFFEGDYFKQQIYNKTAGNIIFTLPAGVVNTSGTPSATTVTIPANSFVELVYQLEDETSPAVIHVYIK